MSTNRIRQWAEVIRLRSSSVPWAHLIRAFLSGSVPRDVWRHRMRKCRRCPIHARVLLRDNRNILTWVGQHLCLRQTTSGIPLGCGCYTPFKALSAAPYPNGCWAHSITENEGWPAHTFPSRWAKLRSVFRFLSPSRR